MSIKFWAPRHRMALYTSFDQVRLYNFAILDASFVGDMLDQKITQKAQRRIENEWLIYWNDITNKDPGDRSKLIVYKINSNQFLLLNSGSALNISNRMFETYKTLLPSTIGENIDEK